MDDEQDVDVVEVERELLELAERMVRRFKRLSKALEDEGRSQEEVLIAMSVINGRMLARFNGDL